MVEGIMLRKDCGDRCVHVIAAVRAEGDTRKSLGMANAGASACHESGGEWAIDDTKGAELEPKGVRRARAGDIAYCEKRNSAVNMPIEKSWQAIGKAPIGVRWIENKGDATNKLTHCRLVAQA